MFGGSAIAVGGALAAVALLYAGVKELLSLNPKGIFWGAILVGGAIAVAGFTGATEGQAVSIIGEILSLVFSVLESVASTVASATGINPTLVLLAIVLLALSAFRGGKSKK